MVDSTSHSLLDQLRMTSAEDAWERFVTLYRPFIVGYLRQHGLGEADAEDVTQNVLEVAFRELPTFQHNGRRGAFRKWLRTVTAHRLSDFHRKNRRRPHAVGGSDFAEVVDQLPNTDSQLSQLWDAEYNRHMVNRLLQMVAPRFRKNTFAAFQRVIIEDQDPQTVADDLGVTINAVRIAQARVLRAIRQLGGELVDL